MLKKWLVTVYTKKYPAGLAFLLNVLLMVAVILNNNAEQYFCIPVLWFAILLIIIAVCFCAYPLLYQFPALQKITLLLSTLWLWVYVFSLIFSINGIYYDGFLPIGLLFVAYLLFFPTLLLLVIIKRMKMQWNKVFKTQLTFFHLTVIILFVAAMFNYHAVANQMQFANTVKKYEDIKNQNAISNYYVERITGAHFIYHTRLCLYDGWRPPLLDPIIALGTTFLGDPISDERHNLISNLGARIKTYKALYPNKPIAQSCKCSSATPQNYYDDLKAFE
jgi:hypothetical protein